MTRRPRSLSEEDKALWQQVASSVEPLDRAPRNFDPDTDDTPSAPPPRAPRQPAPPREPPVRRTAVETAPVTPPMQKRPPAAPVSIDRRRQRRIASGRHVIDARIDLHGMTQDQAFGTLRAFLASCAQRGDKLVLVITGKGGPPTEERGDDPWSGRDRGVLRRNVPRWLTEPSLAAMIVGFGPASSRHGGDGALYVELRTRRRG